MWKRLWLIPLVGLCAFVYLFVFGKVLRIDRRRSWPPPPSAITSEGAQAAAESFAARGSKSGDVGLDYAWSTAASIEPWAEGTEFFPRILADLEQATSSIHILMFGWKPGEVGAAFTELLERKLTDGVEVRVLVDAFGSRPYGLSEDMYARLDRAGAEIMVNNFFPPRLEGRYPGQTRRWESTLPGRCDHRKLYVIDGEIAWTGGAGIEDHFNDGRFHDVMVRVTGDVVRQAQAVFLTSFSSHGPDLPEDLTPYFPAPETPGSIPIAIGQVVPGGFVSATESALELIDAASTRLDIMNPYFTDGEIVERVIAAAKRGVEVRVVVSERSNNGLATATLRNRYAELLAAGVEVWEYPGAVVHAKLVVADDQVQFGTLNLDAWALYRNFEFAMVANDGSTAAAFRERVFDPDIARSHPGRPPEGALAAAKGWAGGRLTYFL